MFRRHLKLQLSPVFHCVCAKRCRKAKVLVTLCVVIGIIVIVVIELHPLLVRWQLLNVANGGRLLTFHSTPYWGIGNSMFAFASTLATARSNSDPPPLVVCFDKHLSMRSAFSPLADWPACNPDDVLDILDAVWKKEDAYARYDSQLIHNLPQDHIVLDRYLQSWKYFVHIEAELRHLFHFNEKVLHAASIALRVAIGNDHDILKIGLHVRRGDIVEQELLIERGYVAADMSYIERAMDFMDHHLGIDNNTGRDQRGRRRLFIVCSDDIDWCLEHMPTHRLTRTEFISTLNPITDLAVLATCHHSIITVGTFGWWAAWLANGTTVYYKNWPRQDSQLAAYTSHDDYFPHHWIPL